MKTERRHELQKNDLVELLSTNASSFEPIIKIAVGALLLLVAIYFVTTTMKKRGKEAAAQSWDEFRMAATEQDMVGLREVADNYPGTEAAGWGLQTAGDLSLATGSMAMYGNRDIAMERLKEARDDFEGALKISGSAKTPLLKQRALLGLAQANEALNDFPAAEDCYERVIKSWPDAAIAKSAESRLAFLKQPATQEFYAWFVKQELAPPPPIRPVDGGSIAPPSVYGDLPKSETLKLPGLDDLGGPDAGGDDLAPPESGGSEPAADPVAE